MKKTNNLLLFNPETHQYLLGDKVLISVTQLLAKHGISTDFSNVNQDVLNKKAERGTLIHKEIEEYIKEGKTGFTEELDEFLQIANEISSKHDDLTTWQSEVVVHNDLIAGTVDIIGNSFIADIKTATTLNKTACQWQLSLYEYLHGAVDNLYVIHLAKKPKLIELERIPIEEIESLLECEKNGVIYNRSVKLNDKTLAELYKAEKVIAEIELRKAEIEEKAKILRDTLYNEMILNGVYNFENEKIKLTLVEPSIRNTVDSKKLKEAEPEIYTKYLKESVVKGSVRITLKAV